MDSRLGAAAGWLLAIGWPATLLITVALGTRPSAGALAMTVAGTATGAVLGRPRKVSRQSLELLPAVCGLHACAALAALDPFAIASAPFFLGTGALAGALPRHSHRALRDGLLIAAGVLAVTALAPGRDAGALANAAILAPAVLLATSIAGYVRVQRRTPALAPVLTGDLTLVHAPLTRRDPVRLARMLDLDAAEIAGAMIERSRRDAAERARATAELIRRLERIELEELAVAEAPAPAPDPELDDLEVSALLAQVDVALREARARRALAAERLML